MTSRSKPGGSETTIGDQHEWLRLGRQNSRADAHQPEGKITATRRFSQNIMTVAACAKWPTNDSSSMCVHERLLLHSSTKVLSQVTFSGGEPQLKLDSVHHDTQEVTAVDGPSVLLAATGMPALANTSMATAAVDATSKVPGAPNRRKSLR